MKNKNKLIEGSIIKSIISLSIPILFANLLQTAYQLTDAFWVGRLGTNAIAAVSISFPILFFLTSLGRGLTMAGTILVSQHKGRENKRDIDHISTQTLSIVFVIAIILAVFGYLFSPCLISLMNTEQKVFLQAVSYIKISFIGIIFVFIYMTFQSLMRGIGDVKTPMFIVLGGVLLNLILDPLFIFGSHFTPSFGVSGAALATIGTQGLSAIVGVYILIKGNHQIQLHLPDLKPDWKIIKKIFHLGLPVSIEQSARSLGMVVMMFLVTSFGTMTLAAYGIGSWILGFIIIPALSLSIATSALVGQNIGAGKIQRAKKITEISSLIGFIVLTTVGLLLFIFAKNISALFIPNDNQTIQASAVFIKYMALTFGFIGVQMSINGLFRGSGNTKISMAISIISLWLLRIPLAYILSRYTSLAEVGLWLAFPIANIVSVIVALGWFFKGTWQEKQLLCK